MNKIEIINTENFFLEKQKEVRISFCANDYLERIDLLLERMKQKGISHVVIYGDREHFSNIEYFTSYDCRFEEGLFMLDSEGKRAIVVGNEGLGYSDVIPFEIDRVLYKNFSLQGQPRDNCPSLTSVFKEFGIDKNSNVGVVGYKYFYSDYYTDPDRHYDLPSYILEELKQAADETKMINFTKELTGLPDGIRMSVRTAKEIAYAEYNAIKCANVILNLLENLRVNISEAELSRKANIDFSPISMFSLVNFGGEHLAQGLRSPDDRRLQLGEVCGLCYGTRGSLCSRTGVAAYDEASYSQSLQPTLDEFYKQYWLAIATWYETVKSGVFGGAVFKAVTDIIGDPKFGLALNPGHNIGMDEWTNSPVYKNSEIPLHDGTYMQCDIIASSSSPKQVAICEDTVIIAGQELRDDLKREYPDVFERILNRQEMMRKVLGISIDDCVLPMSNLNGVYFPFMLNTGKIFTKSNSL